jgi:DNA invertase Pin-like site-specific DNA recombinase
MNTSAKILPQHLYLQAVVYIRQSTAKQVLTNQESTKRQYQLVEKAQQMGWPLPRIQVIDDDLGVSGAGLVQRPGFERLVAAISLGQIGIVLVTEVSRLSRRNSDWHRVIELCAVFQTLIADEDGLYDPRDPNDRLVLGLKGTLFSAELHILQARMRGCLLQKARRGELALRLPVGYRRLADGQAILAPDAEVRHTLERLFAQFQTLKNARAVQRYFLQHQLKMPRLVQTGPDAGRIVWLSPTYQMVQQVLTNPVYAGVFVYGRRKLVTTPGDPPSRKEHRLPLEDWEIVVPEVYPAYISYEQYVANRRALRENLYNFVQQRRGAAREGGALLQGIIRCGRCGRRMTVSYGSAYASYQCRQAQTAYAQAQCQGFSVQHLDQAISAIFLEAIQPARLESMLQAMAVMEQERQALDRHWQLRLERARYQVERARRQYDASEPEHRLVTRELEKQWNEALEALTQLEHEYTLVQRQELAPLSAAEQHAVRQLGEDLPAVWQAPTTTAVDRKRLLRLVMLEVTLTVETQTRSATCVITWSGGAHTTHQVTLPPLGWHCWTERDVVDRIRHLAHTTPDHQIAAHLNAEGLRTKTGKVWTYQRVFSLRKSYQIPTACPVRPQHAQARGDGLVSAKTAAQILRVSPSLVPYWVTHGVLVGDQRVAASKLWVRLTAEDIARLDGSYDGRHLPPIREVMHRERLTRDEVWALVRTGTYLAYRIARGQTWEWRLQRVHDPTQAVVTTGGPPETVRATALT